MMKNTISSPYRKLRLLLILPVAALVLYAFAEPQYRVTSGEQELNSSAQAPADLARKVSGVVTDDKGSPLEGAVVVINGTTVGTLTDGSGQFALKDVPDDAVLVISYVGFVTKAVSVKTAGDYIKTQLQRGNMITDTVSVAPPPPPPPPPPPANGQESSLTVRTTGKNADPLVVLDGKVTNKPLSEISPDEIASINVLKGESAILKYGEKARDGVLEITTKKNPVASSDKPKDVTVTGYGNEKSKEVFVVVEEMPAFPGGMEAMMLWISQRVKYPEQAKKEGITGLVMVSFVVNKTGKVTDVAIERSAYPLLDAEAVRVVREMPDWKPGSQRGKPVDVKMTVPVKFSLK